MKARYLISLVVGIGVLMVAVDLDPVAHPVVTTNALTITAIIWSLYLGGQLSDVNLLEMSWGIIVRLGVGSVLGILIMGSVQEAAKIMLITSGMIIFYLPSVLLSDFFTFTSTEWLVLVMTVVIMLLPFIVRGLIIGAMEADMKTLP